MTFSNCNLNVMLSLDCEHLAMYCIACLHEVFIKNLYGSTCLSGVSLLPAPGKTAFLATIKKETSNYALALFCKIYILIIATKILIKNEKEKRLSYL